MQDFPDSYRAIMSGLIKVGYRSLIPPKPLCAAVCDVLGIEPDKRSNDRVLVDLGEARVVAMGANTGDVVVINLPKHGDYRASLRIDLYFAGTRLASKGKLLCTANFHVFCCDDSTEEDARRLARLIEITPHARKT
jgi:hypothetical protein